MAAIQDDYGWDWSTTGVLGLDQKVTAWFEGPADLDAFKITLQADVTYLISLTGRDQGGGTLNGNMAEVYLDIIDRNGTTVDGTIGTKFAGYDVGPIAQFTPTQSGDYLIRAAQYFGSAGSYTVDARIKPAGDDFASDISTTGVLLPGGTASGRFEVGGDKDWFKFEAELGQHYAFSIVQGDGLINPTFTYLLHADGTGVYEQLMYPFEPMTSGVYYVGVEGLVAGSYTIRSRLLIDDYSSNFTTSGKLAPGATVSGELQYREDRDFFKISMKAGVEYTIVLSPDRLDVNGLQLDMVDSTGRTMDGKAKKVDSTWVRTITPSTSGDYYVDIHTDTLPGGLTRGAYTLTVRDSPGAGNDLLKSDGKGAQIDAGAGVDLVEYQLAAAHYQIQRKDGKVSVQAAGSAAGDTLSGVERLKFSDTAIAVDIDGVGGQAYRLYQAAFNRAPDKVGIGYWLAQMDKGLSLHNAAASFMGSSEFSTMYGSSLSDSAFVDQLYQNVLHRAGDTGGVNYWLGALQNGLARPDLLSSFSESAENIAALVGVINNGYAYTPYAA